MLLRIFMDKRKRHKVLRDLRGTRNRCVFAVHLHHAPHHTVRSSQFAVIHHTNRCWSLINCLFISCFFRIFRIKMTRGVEVLGRLRRTRNRCVFAVHAMPSYMPPYMPSINAINSFGGLSESRSVKTLIYHLGVATSACITSYALAI